MAEVMHFKSGSVHPGLNLTVRAGDKWGHLMPGEHLTLQETGSNRVIGSGEVVFTLETSFEHIPEAWFKYNQAPGARNRAGLVQAMDAAYGAGNWELLVTAVLFMAMPKNGL